MNRTLTIASSILLFAAGQQTFGETVYFDDFSGTSGSLHGTTPDIGTSSWVSSSTTGANGVFTNNDGGAFLPITLTDGMVYTVSVDVQNPNTNTWVAVGFGSGLPATPNISTFVHKHNGSDINGRAWMLYRAPQATAGQAIQAFLGPSTAGPVNLGGTDPAIDYSAFHNLTVVVDTDANTVDYLLNGSSLSGGPVALGFDASDTITSVGLSYDPPNGTPVVTVDNFIVTAVPEPGSLALLGLGTLLVARRRRA